MKILKGFVVVRESRRTPYSVGRIAAVVAYFDNQTEANAFADDKNASAQNPYHWVERLTE